ncbi:ATP-binding protein [Celeribacter sp.]|uniref:ATP-binding protein n=1 Tax=Celeribacter sp. TaxID=1890673 RepID=UPI003A908702
MIGVVKVSSQDLSTVLARQESHFLDFKGKEIKPARLSKTVSAFANASGGEIIVGIEEVSDPHKRALVWNGFENQEAANGFLQMIHGLDPVGSNFSVEFWEAEGENGLTLHIQIEKTQSVITGTDGNAYVRKGAQSIKVTGDALDRLRFDKGLVSYEDELVNSNHDLVSNSDTIIEFMLDMVPTGEPYDWLMKQSLISDDRPNVAAILLFADSPQAILPKRSAIKILRYQTKDDAERDYLVGDPETIEGPLYTLIYEAVARVREIIEGIEKLGPKGMEKVEYPEEALHELVTNAVLHRDYSIAADVQIRIFDNRVEIESPGKLPGHVTSDNIAKTQFARNPRIVRLINKFKNPPNKDVGEGINTALEVMEKLRLKNPIFEEKEAGFLVTLKHESLASPEQMVLDYLKSNPQITNQQARELTGIKSENTMKNVFYRLREAGEIEQTPKVKGKKHSWRRIVSDSENH